MMKFKKYAEEIMNDPQKEHEFNEIACEAMEEIKRVAPDVFHRAVFKMHKLVHGVHFDECLAKKAVARMKNVDGSTGEHWTYEQIENVSAQHGIKCIADMYYAMNMLYSDLATIMGEDASTYIKLAKALYFTDPDMPEGKLFRSWYALNCEDV